MNNKQKEFKSLNAFYSYIMEEQTKVNKVFKDRETNKNLGSNVGDYSFTETHDFAEAIELFKHGWDSKAKELEKGLKISKVNPTTKQRAQFDVVGFQASVPRYLQGVPTNMVNKKTVTQKQKVITLTKDISYSGFTSTSKILDWSITALKLVKAIEEQGTRVNLNIILGTKTDKESVQLKIRIKSASERLNISKLAFPLCHPSMLRRLLFRFLEQTDLVTDYRFSTGYGKPISQKDMIIDKDEIIIPKEFEEKDIEQFIKNI